MRFGLPQACWWIVRVSVRVVSALPNTAGRGQPTFGEKPAPTGLFAEPIDENDGGNHTGHRPVLWRTWKVREGVGRWTLLVQELHCGEGVGAQRQRRPATATSRFQAVREGCAIPDNIRKFLRCLLLSTMGEVLTVFLGVVGAGVIGLKSTGVGDAGGIASGVLIYSELQELARRIWAR